MIMQVFALAREKLVVAHILGLHGSVVDVNKICVWRADKRHPVPGVAISSSTSPRCTSSLYRHSTNLDGVKNLALLPLYREALRYPLMYQHDLIYSI